jgi:hypothetical protein
MSEITTKNVGEPIEITIPARKETFTAQVLVTTKERTEKQYYNPFICSGSAMDLPMAESRRVIGAGKFSVELVCPPLIGAGNPTLIIQEL